MRLTYLGQAGFRAEADGLVLRYPPFLWDRRTAGSPGGSLEL